MPEDIGFSGMRNTKQTVVGGGKVRCVCVCVGGCNYSTAHMAEVRTRGSCQEKAADQAINAESTKMPGCQWEPEAISLPARGVCLHGSLSLQRPDPLMFSDQVSTLWGRGSWAQKNPPKKPSALLSGKRCHVSWQLAASCYLPSISFICVNDRCCQKF